jgi:hypothetical protein
VGQLKGRRSISLERPSLCALGRAVGGREGFRVRGRRAASVPLGCHFICDGDSMSHLNYHSECKFPVAVHLGERFARGP